ncbi:hypothetical protein PVW46_14565 [Mameliella sp. AT18]|uniref:hypothetical protein n=1 Tax=Mameliella sp. AT18 TaxID=3028385 RepID=UPI0008411F96|nr:hypothetical protein [Mameliella sp. AT18]MDD9731135.1 hypothetical protein [Mameliella sp. AT18]ODM50435.1 hypothetical protein A9320_01450 [Ruegeria sp. PBVC088]
MRRLIFVHGINNESYTREDITKLWGDALRKSIGSRADSWWDEVEVRTAYYATTLARETADWDEMEATGTRMSVGSPETDYADEDVAGLYLALQRAYGINDDRVAQELEPGDDRTAATRMAAGIHKKWLKAIARTLEKVIPSAADGLARKFLAQAATYLNKPGVFDQINEMVNDQVFEDLDPLDRTVVVGHSLGTIVSYVLLRRMVRENTLPVFVTLGSPLGIDIVRNRVGHPRITPPVAARWVNGSDPEDFVALRPSLDQDNFGPAEIVNYPMLDNGHEDAHSIERYLAHSEIAEVIYAGLK